MLITNKKTFSIGIIMLLGFIAVFFYMMSPSFGAGVNGLQYAENMFNSLSKGSAYFVQGEMAKAEGLVGQELNVNVSAANENEAQIWAQLYNSAGAVVTVDGADLYIQGDVGQILNATLTDCDAMYNDQGEQVSSKHNNLDPQVATYSWYNSLKAISGALDNQKNFAQSAVVQSVMTKAIEPAYNYYGIDPKNVVDYKGIVFFLLAFYLVYTLWYGFAIYYIFDGVGITMTKAAKKVEA